MRGSCGWLLAIGILCGCSSEPGSSASTSTSTIAPTTSGTGTGGSGGADAGPAWLGDAGLATRAPAATPLHSICGIASNPGDMPLGDGPAEVALRSGYFEAANDLGGVMIRRDVRWDEVEPAKGSFDFARYDALVADAEQAGVRILATLDYGTKWAHPGATTIFWPPDDPADFASYAGTVAARYPATFVGYEIWNEPNAGFRFWQSGVSGDPAGYGTLLTQASAAIHAADPGAKVALGGTVFTPQFIEGAMDWLGDAYAARPDLAQSFDIAGIHTYQYYPPATAPELGDEIDAPLEDKIKMHAWLLDQHGASDRPLWITEIGWPVAAPIDEAGQARLTVRATILAARAGASGIFWYTLRDGPNPEQLPPEHAFGLLHHDADPAAGNPPSPKPVYTALRALLHTVGERWPSTSDAANAGAGPGAYVVAFAGSDPGKVFAMWTTEASGSVVAPADGEILEQDGSARGPVKKGDAVALSGDVIYLR